MADSVITEIAKKKMVEARAGIHNLAHIAGVAFGNGAAGAAGEIRIPLSTDTALQGQLLRQEIDGYEIQSDTCIRYICTLNKETLAGETINEAALYDEDGDLVAIKSFTNKGKDDDMEMIFQIEDTF